MTRTGSIDRARSACVLATLLYANAVYADPACIAAFESMDSLRAAGRLKEALQQATICAQDACRSNRKEVIPANDIPAVCTRTVDAIRAEMPSVVLAATGAKGEDLVDVRVLIDGEPLLEKLDGRANALDPGPHKLVFEWAGHGRLEELVLIRVGEKNRHIHVSFPPDASKGPAGTGATSAGTRAPSMTTLPLPPPPPVVPEGDEGGTPTWAWVAGGAGILAGAGAGVAFAIKAAADAELDANCGPKHKCPPGVDGEGTYLRSETARAIAIAGAVAAGVGISAAVIGIVTAPPRRTLPVRGAAWSLAPWAAADGIGGAVMVRY